MDIQDVVRDLSIQELSALRALFPITRECAYFDAAANGPLATPVRQAVDEYLSGLAARGSRDYPRWQRISNETRQRAAELLGASPDEIALVRNTSEGINIVANGLRLGPGDSVVLIRGDFPANVHPWLRSEDDGATVRFVEPDVLNRVTTAQILDRCDASTRIVSVSAVSFWNGYRIDLESLCGALAERGILLFVDAIQALGLLELNLRRLPIDFLSADAHKGLLTPEGIGLFFVRKARLEELKLSFVSWLSMQNPFENQKYERRLLPDARRFEYASPNSMGIHALSAALKLLLSTGVQRIERHVLRLTDRLASGLKQRGYHLASPRGERERSSIVAFTRPGFELEELHRRLIQNDVVVASRAGSIRASAHVYNDDTDVERLLAALPE